MDDKHRALFLSERTLLMRMLLTTCFVFSATATCFILAAFRISSLCSQCEESKFHALEVLSIDSASKLVLDRS
jgi:hypothetical protein